MQQSLKNKDSCSFIAEFYNSIQFSKRNDLFLDAIVLIVSELSRLKIMPVRERRVPLLRLSVK